ncbi:hypothetical protein HYX17_03745 [Candidatus Woesearchaeota archaeon]|nr:hypothetical protein [Candidatus Woesearchaeota archaeon]
MTDGINASKVSINGKGLCEKVAKFPATIKESLLDYNDYLLWVLTGNPKHKIRFYEEFYRDMPMEHFY